MYIGIIIGKLYSHLAHSLIFLTDLEILTRLPILFFHTVKLYFLCPMRQQSIVRLRSDITYTSSKNITTKIKRFE